MLIAEKRNVYEQIVAELKILIETGAMRYGEKLPSVRTYAVERKVNPNTVAKAYAELEKARYIRMQPKKGGYVCYGEADSSAEKRGKDTEVWVSAIYKQGVAKEELLAVIDKIYGEGGNND